MEQSGGRWWIVDPTGARFLSKGVGAVRFEGDRILDTEVYPFREANTAKYGTKEAWHTATETRLHDWGFNTLGAWSDTAVSGASGKGTPLAHTPILDTAAAFVASKQQGQAWLHGIFPDVFGGDFEAFAFERMRELAAPHRDDRRILGWFVDNELRWGPDWRGPDELLTLFLALPAGTPGKAAAVGLLRKRHADIAAFNAVWKTPLDSWEALAAATAITPPVIRKAFYEQNQGAERKANEADPLRAAFFADCEAFLGLLADRYFDVTNRALKAADPNHCNLGCRFAYLPPDAVLAAAALHTDALSFNCYETDPAATLQRYAAFGKPLIIGEFSFRGEDSGLPNTKGAGPWVKTQADRGAAFEAYVTTALRNPGVVGYHWFRFSDEPKEGRFDGENSNYGIVTIRDEVYEPLAAAMRRVNRAAEAIHAGR